MVIRGTTGGNCNWLLPEKENTAFQNWNETGSDFVSLWLLIQLAKHYSLDNEEVFTGSHLH